MKKILYLTNIEVPYRVRFFNELSRYCDLTVLYERQNSSNRNDKWAKGEQKKYSAKYLRGIKVKGESTFSFGILKEVCGDYDAIIVGCYNSPVQMMAMLFMRLLKIPYIINVDGEPFLEGNNLKSRLKRFFLAGAEKYLIAGQKAAQSLTLAAGKKEVTAYHFSSLSEKEVQEHSTASEKCRRNNTILVVGQYFDYKGMDIALEAARMDQAQPYRFVGMGARTEQFKKDFSERIPPNVEIIPFLQKEELGKEYLNGAMLLLPSRQECWGLVINEAASYGMPIVSTWGSGAAVDFLADNYPQFLAKPADAEDLLNCVDRCRSFEKLDEYRKFLLEKSKSYTIEENVRMHLELLGI